MKVEKRKTKKKERNERREERWRLFTEMYDQDCCQDRTGSWDIPFHGKIEIPSSHEIYQDTLIPWDLKFWIKKIIDQIAKQNVVQVVTNNRP